MAKKTFLFILIVVLIAVSALILYRLLRPEVRVLPLSEVERIFPGGEAAFVGSKGLKDVWDLFEGSDYYRKEGYAPLLNIPILEEFSVKIEGVEGEIGRDIRLDLLMYLLGREAALGLYPEDIEGGAEGVERGLDYLLVSRVYPEVLFVERLATFFAGNKYLTDSSYRGLKVKEIAINEGEGDDIHKIVYAIDGDLLILAGDGSLFTAAADRHLDGGSGGLSDDGRFLAAREKVNSGFGRRPYIFGFVDSEMLKEIPAASEAVARIKRYLSGDLITFGARFMDLTGGGFDPYRVKVYLETGRGGNRGFSNSKTTLFEDGFGRAYISDDELLLVRAYDLSLVPEGVIDGSSAAKDIFFSTLSRLFFDGFTASVVEGHDKCPGFVAWGKAPPGALKIVEETTEKNGWKISKGSLEGLDYDLEILSIVDPKDVDKELMAVAVKGNTLFVGESEDTLAALIDRAEGGGSGGTIKMALLSRLKGGEEGISLKAKPAPLWESMEECPSAFEMLSASLFPSSKENSLFRSREFVRGLYPVKELAVDIRPAAGGVTAEIIIDIDAKMNEE